MQRAALQLPARAVLLLAQAVQPPAALATGDTCTGIGACPANGAAAATCVCNGKTVTCNRAWPRGAPIRLRF